MEQFGGEGGFWDKVHYEIVQESEASSLVNTIQVYWVHQFLSFFEQIALIDCLRLRIIVTFSKTRMTQLLKKLIHFFHVTTPGHF